MRLDETGERGGTTEAPIPKRMVTQAGIPSSEAEQTVALVRAEGCRRRRLRSEADVVALPVRHAEVLRATGRRRVRLRFESRATPADADGRLKGLLDALVACGALVR